MTIEIATGGEIPTETPPISDDPPAFDNPQENAVTGQHPNAPFPQYPDSTPDAPYGRKPDGTPYKRHHSGHGKREGSSGGSKVVASATQARAAAAMLAQLNNMVCMSLMFAGLPNTAATIQANNTQFEGQAYEALLTDPALCRKILSAGTSSAKTQLILAYGMLGMSAVSVALPEFKERKANAEVDE